MKEVAECVKVTVWATFTWTTVFDRQVEFRKPALKKKLAWAFQRTGRSENGQPTRLNESPAATCWEDGRMALPQELPLGRVPLVKQFLRPCDLSHKWMTTGQLCAPSISVSLLLSFVPCSSLL